MKYILIACLAFVLVGCGSDIKNTTTIVLKNTVENYGKWVIEASDEETKYFYVFRLSEEKFKKLWNKGIDLTLYPQKHYDSEGKGQEIMERIKSNKEN